MKVVVRVRPDNSQENGSRSIISVIGEQLLVFDPKEDYDDFYFQGVKQRDVLRKSNKNMEFSFDRVFDGCTLNKDVYEHTTMTILDGLLDGYNCSVFAYGATGAGKTFTMLGNLEHPGITFLTMMDLFSRIEAAKAEKTIDVAISYLEVYNENIRDLLSPGPNLQIREDPQRGVVVAGLKLCKPTAADELLDMLRGGNKNRTQHPTDANAESSRSHAVFTVYVKQHDRTGKKNTKVAKMSLIDLAGSERATMVSKNRGSRMREGANINKSLLALGNCINALAERKAKAHIPYRDSKLTRLLKDSLDGNCCTIMIAAVSPSTFSYEDTYNTLKYASRAKNIKMKLKQNVLTVDLHLNQYAKLVEELRKEVSMLKSELQKKNDGAVELPSRRVEIVAPMPPIPAGPTVEEVKAKRVIEGLFTERLSLQRQYLHVAGQAQQLKLKIHRRRQKIQNLSLVSVDFQKLDGSIARSDKALGSLVSRRAAALEKSALLDQQLQDNQVKLSRAEPATEALKEWIGVQHLKQNIQQERQRGNHLERIAMELDMEYDRSNSLSCSLMKILRRQYLILKANSLATCDVDEDYNFVSKLVEGCKAVSWADQVDADKPLDGDDSTVIQLKDVLNLNLASLAKATESDCAFQPILTVPPKAEPIASDAVVTVNCGVATVIRQDLESGQSFAKLRKIDSLPIRKKCGTPPCTVPTSVVVPSETVPPVIAAGTKRTSEVLGDCDTTFTMPSPMVLDSPLPLQNCDKTFVKSTPTFDKIVTNLTFLESPRSPLGQTNGRRLTFDAPVPSILKIMDEKIPVSPNLAAQLQKENATASTDKQQATRALLRKTRSYQNLPSRSATKTFDLSNIKALDKLKKEGFPVVTDNELEKLKKGFPVVTDTAELARQPEEKKRSWGLMRTFKSVNKPVASKPPISSRIAKSHPYHPPQAQRLNVHQSAESLSDSQQKRTQPLRNYNILQSSKSNSKQPNGPTKPSLLRKTSHSLSNLGALVPKKI